MTQTIVAQAVALIERRTGLAVSTQFKNDIGAILTTLAGGDLARFLTALRTQPESAPVWQAVISALTIGETHFLRDRIHMAMLRETILPELITARRSSGTFTLNIWSAGCSTGEEPYSVALLLTELLPDLPRWTIRLIGTDLNAAALEKASHAVYRRWAFRHTSENFQNRYFDHTEAGLSLKPQFRRMVTFRQSSLLGGAPLPQCDLILCRNVLLYLTKAAVQQVENQLFDTLVSEGWLLLGQAEAIHTDRERWRTHIFPGAVCYQKPPAYQRGETITHFDLPAPTSPLRQPKDVKPTAPLSSASGGTAQAVPQGGTYADAVNAMQQNRQEDAERILADVLATQTDHAQARTLLACIFANRGALPEAHTHLDLALRKDPLLADAHYLRAMLHLESAQPTFAEKELRAALYCRQTHPLAALMLGNLYADMGDLLRARKAWIQARESIAGLPSDCLISDLSDMTAEGLSALVTGRLGD